MVRSGRHTESPAGRLGCSSSRTTAPVAAVRPPAAACARRTPHDHDPHASARILAQPGRNLLLHHPEEVLTPNDFTSTGTLSQTLLAFADRYNLTARPFNWKFSADDLTALFRRISKHEQASARPAWVIPNGYASIPPGT